jgi:hypothetical protein
LVNGAHQIFNLLLPVAFVICVAGLLIYTFRAQGSHSYPEMMRGLVRVMIIALVIPELGSWGDLLMSGVNDLVSQTGGGNGVNLIQAYQAAVARKLGTAAAAQNVKQATGFNAPAAPDAGGSLATPQPINGVKITAYGYPGDTNGDSNSAQGIGAFPFSSAPGSLIAGYSAALSPDQAQAYNVQPGQQFTVTTTGGQSYNLVYADKTDPSLTGRIDIYDPQQLLGNGNDNAFSQGVTSFNDGPVVQGQTGTAAMLPNPGGSMGDQILWAFALFLSWAAEGIMFLMRIVQQVLFLIEIAVCPLLLSLAMIPATAHIAGRYIMGLVAIALWPLGWALCNLITLGLLDLGVNSSNNTALGVTNTVGVYAPLAGLGYLILLALWVIGSTLSAPVVIGRMLNVAGAGTTAVAAVFGATVGAAAANTASSAGRAVGGLPGAAVGVANMFPSEPGVMSVQSGSRMNGMRPNYATRPMETEKKDT